MTQRASYPSDMTDEQWQFLEPLVPAPAEGYRPAEHSRREIVNAILYQQRTGCQWRYLPHDFPPWATVADYYYRWTRSGVWKRLNDSLREKVREKHGRGKHPTVGIIDSQSVKTTEAGGERGYDPGKKVKGRKRHLAVDTLGMLLAVVVSAASVQDRDGGRWLLGDLSRSQPSIKMVYVDSAYNDSFPRAAARHGYAVVMGKKEKAQKGFVPQTQRWVGERTFGWVGRDRRMSKDYERQTRSSQARVYISMVGLMTKRLAGITTTIGRLPKPTVSTSGAILTTAAVTQPQKYQEVVASA